MKKNGLNFIDCFDGIDYEIKMKEVTIAALNEIINGLNSGKIKLKEVTLRPDDHFQTITCSTLSISYFTQISPQNKTSPHT